MGEGRGRGKKRSIFPVLPLVVGGAEEARLEKVVMVWGQKGAPCFFPGKEGVKKMPGPGPRYPAAPAKYDPRGRHCFSRGSPGPPFVD